MRKSGVLMPITSLPSQFGIGCFSDSAYNFIDWLHDSGQAYWQILPLGPTGFGDSPYQSFSTFAGNPYMISLKSLVAEGLLTADECKCSKLNTTCDTVDYELQYLYRIPLLQKAFQRWHSSQDKDYLQFKEENDFWLDDYAMFSAFKRYYGDKAINYWDKGICHRHPKDIDNLKIKLNKEIDFFKFVQFVFYKQWEKLKSYANEKGISIIGDIPIYVSYDSSDVWANPELFDLDSNLMPNNVAGCPPDGFSKSGQLWGNPLYNWQVHEKTGFKWWIKRVEHCLKIFDVLRIDHFRGFDEYYSIKYGSADAKDGKWCKGPGIKLFNAIKDAIPNNNIIAEDLGFVTPSVKLLLENCGYPGMKVLQFAFDTRDTGDTNSYLPHNYPEKSVAYTGTHDNQTLKGWFDKLSDEEKLNVRQYLCDMHTPDNELNIPLIALLMRSNAGLCIVPVQDWLELGDESRINTPSTLGNNWQWRLNKEQLSANLSKKIYNMTKLYGRF